MHMIFQTECFGRIRVYPYWKKILWLSYTGCPWSFVNFYITILLMKMDKTSWTCSIDRNDVTILCIANWFLYITVHRSLKLYDLGLWIRVFLVRFGSGFLNMFFFRCLIRIFLDDLIRIQAECTLRNPASLYQKYIKLIKEIRIYISKQVYKRD